MSTTIIASIKMLQSIQKDRIRCGNIIIAQFKKKKGIPQDVPIRSDVDAFDLLEQLRFEYNRLTDGVVDAFKGTVVDSDLITHISELALINSYETQLKLEKIHFRAIKNELKSIPLWVEFLADIKGCGPLLAGSILAEIDIHKCNTPSSLWAYCGLDTVVVTDAKTGVEKREGRGRKRTHLVPRTYVNFDGEITDTVGLSYNPTIKSRLLGVLGPSFLKTKSPYADIYYEYKNRLQNSPAHSKKSKLHIHNMAIRYMVKEFLVDLWLKWRELEKLPTRSRYSEEKLGLHHSKAPRVSVCPGA